jgi:hypothetical protein
MQGIPMTIDTKNAPLALEMIKAELGGRPTMNTLQTFLLIAEYERGDARDLERLLKATSGTVSRALAFWTDKNLIVRERIAALMNPHRPVITPAPSEPRQERQRPADIPAPVVIAPPEQIEPIKEPEPIREPAPAPIHDPGPKETSMPFVPNMPTVVIVGADKGGVGMTTLSRVILDYFSPRGLATRAFDTESPKGSLKRFFSSITEVVNLRDSDDQVKVFDTIGTSAITLIDIRAGLLTDTLTLLTEIGFLDMVKDGKINVAVMHVIGSTMDSFGEIEATSKQLTGSKHCIVLNLHGLSRDLTSRQIGRDLVVDVASPELGIVGIQQTANYRSTEEADDGSPHGFFPLNWHQWLESNQQTHGFGDRAAPLRSLILRKQLRPLAPVVRRREVLQI